MPAGHGLTTSDPIVSSMLDAVARGSYGKLVALLSARSRDIAAAEDALSEAFTIALTEWQTAGCPSKPEAWLLTVARRKMIDALRKDRFRDRSDEDIDQIAATLDCISGDDEIPDRRLALIFACAHPAIDETIRTPLILQTLLGLNAERIASAFLTSPSAMGKRLVRAKTKIRQAGIALRVPGHEELSSRLDTVVEAIYAAFTAGWSEVSETGTLRTDLAEEAIFLGRLVVDLLPNEPEPMGLLSLMLYVHARRQARREDDGNYVPLEEQDPARWDRVQITEAELFLDRASRLHRIGRYQLEAAVQSAHVYRLLTGKSIWQDVVQLYDALFSMTQSPVVAVNRAVAVAEAEGPERGLEMMPSLSANPVLSEYQPYWAARAELLTRCQKIEDAEEAYQRGKGLTCDPSARDFLDKRYADLRSRRRKDLH
jgi:predicted RNA polymerase sigma factor